MTRRMLVAGVVSCAGLVPLSASALMLGEIAAHSYLGQIFRATIPLSPGAGEELDSRCFTLIRPARQDGGVYLSHAHLSLEQKKGQLHLSIRSTNTINEPFVQLLLQADCGQGRLEREFVVLLDPEVRAPAQPPVVTREVILDPQVEPPPETVRVPRPPRAAQPASPAAPKSAGVPGQPRQASASTRGNARRSEPESPVAARTGEPGEFRLRLSSSEELDLSMLGKLSEEQRQQLREKQRLLDADDQVANTLSMKNRIMQLESQLDQLQAELAKTNSRLASGTPPAPVPAPVSVPSSPPLTDRLLAVGENVSFRGMAGVGLILALLLSVWWRWRRRQAEAWLDAELRQEFPANEAYQIPVAQPDDKFAAAPAQAAENVKEDDFYHSVTSIFDTESESVTFTEAESVLDEADLYLAYGWANRAVELLQEYLEKHPEDPLLWKKLFETYSSQGMKQEFEQLALRCQATQDDSGLWVLVQKLGRQLDEENPLYLASPEQQLEETAEALTPPEPEVPTLDTPLEFVLHDRETEAVKQEEQAREGESLELDPLFPELVDEVKKDVANPENPGSTAGR